MSRHELHAQALEFADPRIDPGLVGGEVKDAVDLAVRAGARQRVDERLAHVADRAGAGDRSLAANGPGQTGGEHLLVVRRPSTRADEVPPRDVLPLAEEPALRQLVRKTRASDALREMGDVVDREFSVRYRRRPSTNGAARPVDRRRADPPTHGRMVAAAQLELAGLRRPGRPTHRSGRCSWRAAHRVDDVAVEAGEEAEAVLAGQPRPAARWPWPAPDSCGPCRRRSSRSSSTVTVEAALGELVRDGEPADAGADHQHGLRWAGGDRRGGSPNGTPAVPAARRAVAERGDDLRRVVRLAVDGPRRRGRPASGSSRDDRPASPATCPLSAPIAAAYCRSTSAREPVSRATTLAPVDDHLLDEPVRQPPEAVEVVQRRRDPLGGALVAGDERVEHHVDPVEVVAQRR